MGFNFERTSWFDFLSHGQQDLVLQAQEIYEQERVKEGKKYHDYSFVVFPMAKAYEGFLKKYLYDLELISEKRYNSDHFRIGKSLNPDLPERYRKHDWVVDRLNATCGKVQEGRWRDTHLSRAFWKCWKRGRNLLFHFFPQHENFITLEEARIRIEEIADVMGAALLCYRDR